MKITGLGLLIETIYEKQNFQNLLIIQCLDQKPHNKQILKNSAEK